MALQMELHVSVDLIAPFTVSAKQLCGSLKLFALKQHGFEPMTSDMCLFKNDRLSVLLLYVDDVLVAASDLHKIREIEENLAFHYELKEFGEVQEFLGISIVRNR